MMESGQTVPVPVEMYTHYPHAYEFVRGLSTKGPQVGHFIRQNSAWLDFLWRDTISGLRVSYWSYRDAIWKFAASLFPFASGACSGLCVLNPSIASADVEDNQIVQGRAKISTAADSHFNELPTETQPRSLYEASVRPVHEQWVCKWWRVWGYRRREKSESNIWGLTVATMPSK